MSVDLYGRNIKEEEKTYIVFEAGATHEGLESAKKLAEVTKEAGADAVKFQFVDADRLMADKDVTFTYQYLEVVDGQEIYRETKEPLYEILKRRFLTRKDMKELKRFCDSIDIPLICTVLFEGDADFLVDELGIQSLKIASADINHLDLIGYCASKGVNIQLDTGNADIWEIERAVIEIESVGNRNVIIHLCPTGYPARLESINLRMLKTLQDMFPDYVIAFSDHSPGWDMDIAAVALGAKLVEKTITLDRTIKSCEHCFSLEPGDAKRFVKTIRDLEVALGSSRRIIPPEEKERRKIGRRSPYALRDIRAGEPVRKDDFEFRRPEAGLSAIEFRMFRGYKLVKGIKKGECLTKDHILDR